jgi:hypothetical protein
MLRGEPGLLQQTSLESRLLASFRAFRCIV